MKLAALYTHGRVVTGCNHGDAFGKLTPDEQDARLVSGFLDVDSGKFISEDCQGFYQKQLIFIRHGEYQQGEQDPAICDAGHCQVEVAADYLASHDLSEYTGFTSPLRRCRETADILSGKTHIMFAVERDIRECEESEDLSVFRSRIENVLSHLPHKSILVSHCDFILHAAHIATGESLHQERRHIPTGSVTIIHHDKIVCMGECVENVKQLYI